MPSGRCPSPAQASLPARDPQVPRSVGLTLASVWAERTALEEGLHGLRHVCLILQFMVHGDIF